MVDQFLFNNPIPTHRILATLTIQDYKWCHVNSSLITPSNASENPNSLKTLMHKHEAYPQWFGLNVSFDHHPSMGEKLYWNLTVCPMSLRGFSKNWKWNENLFHIRLIKGLYIILPPPSYTTLPTCSLYNCWTC